MLVVGILILTCAVHMAKGTPEVSEKGQSKFDTWSVDFPESPESKRGLTSEDAMRFILYYLSKMSSYEKSRNSRPLYERGTKRIGSEFLGKRSHTIRQPVRGDTKGGRRMGSEFLGKRLIGSEFLGKRTSIDFDILAKRIGSEFLGKRTSLSELYGKRPSSMEVEDLAETDDRIKRSTSKNLAETG